MLEVALSALRRGEGHGGVGNSGSARDEFVRLAQLCLRLDQRGSPRIEGNVDLLELPEIGDEAHRMPPLRLSRLWRV